MNFVGVLSRVPKTRLQCIFLVNRMNLNLLSGHTLIKNPPAIPTARIIKLGTINAIKIREFHVTCPNRALPPLLILILRPVFKILAAIFGRRVRIWWQRLSPSEKQMIIDEIRAKHYRIAMATGFVCGMFVFYYYDHIAETPITSRKRFIILRAEEINKIAAIEYKNQIKKYSSDIVPRNHPFYQRTARVTNTLLNANRDIAEVRNKDWALTVVDRPDITNAFSFPDGKIFVFSGILNVCSNDDQLAVVLSHEISHTILSHVAESLSKMIFVEAALVVPSVTCWIIFTEAMAAACQWLTDALAKLMIHLPFSRAIEREADEVGLELAAKACYDVREAPNFWSKMNSVSARPTPVEWLSTHPSDATRQKELKKLLPEALKIRNAHHCPSLKNQRM